MAVAEMCKLNLVAMSYDRDAVLNALQRTGAAEIKLHDETENTAPMSAGGEEIRAYLAETEAALSLLSAEVEAYGKEKGENPDIPADGFEISYKEFIGASGLKAEADACVEKINALEAERKALASEISKLNRTKKTAEIYACIKQPLNGFADTPHTIIKLGTIPAAAKDKILTAVSEIELADCKILFSDDDNVLVFVCAHKSAAHQTDAALQEAGFSSCPFAGDVRSGEEINSNILDAISEAEASLERNREELYSLNASVKTLKIYCDYLAFELEKAELAEKMRATQTTFLLESYVPKDAQEAVKAELDNTVGATYYEFSEPAEDEIPPTLYKNNAVVKNFETITNMYSPVNSREFDPNAVMAVFYSLFLGFIMGDVGYGLIMFLGGGAIYLKNRARDNGLKRLSGVFAIGGICAIVWGFLFNSFFGTGVLLPYTVMPNAQNDMWSFLGISVPAVLVISLVIGIIQLMTGYICRAIQLWRRGKVWDGIWDGVTWALFSLGVGLAVVGLVQEANCGILATVGGITAGVSLLAAILTAGRHEKRFGKFTKGFGAAYGVINYASDILSYARLYGLMLSGAVIAQIVSQYSVQFITGGNVAFIILGVVLMLIGHAFNLAMGLLGAYIHDARLQYVEFYGRFYEGEGELFAPLGSKHKYISISG